MGVFVPLSRWALLAALHRVVWHENSTTPAISRRIMSKRYLTPITFMTPCKILISITMFSIQILLFPPPVGVPTPIELFLPLLVQWVYFFTSGGGDVTRWACFIVIDFCVLIIGGVTPITWLGWFVRVISSIGPSCRGSLGPQTCLQHITTVSGFIVTIAMLTPVVHFHVVRMLLTTHVFRASARTNTRFHVRWAIVAAVIITTGET